MGLIENMSKKGARAGVKLPVPTAAGDDQVIAAKTGEYVLPPEVVAAIGLDKLNALVQSITGQAPGGEPAEMPEGAMHEMMEGEMEGHAKGGCVKGMKGYATGGLISQFDGVRLNADPLQDNAESLRKYRFNDGMGADSVATEVSRAAQGMPQADEVMQLGMDKMAQKARPSLSQIREWESMGALGEDSNIMGFNNGGLIARMKGYAEGGLIEDELTTRQRLSNYNPHSTIRKPEPFSPNANNLRNHYPNASIPPNATTNASPRAPELRSYTPEPGRLQPGATAPRITGLASAAPAGTPSATVRALDARVPGDAAAVEAQRAKAAAQAGKLTGEAQRAASAAAAAPKPAQPGLISRAAQKAAPLVKGGTAFALNSGVNQSFADLDTGYRDEFARSVGAESPVGAAAADTARTFANIGDAVTLGLAGRVGRGIASATGGGSFGAGFASDSDRDRFLASKQPQQVAAAPQLTPQELSDEIARRRAALEPPQAAVAPTANATPTQAIAAAPAPARGPVSGLAARAAKPAAAAAPATTQPMDGAVEIIRGQNRSWAVPELGYQEVPDEVYRSGRIGEYMQAQSNNMMDRADPMAAELRNRLAEIAAQGDNSIRVSNATDRDGEGRGLRNAAARMELDLRKRALAGDQQAIAQLNMLFGKGGAQDEYVATTREALVDPSNPLAGTIKEPVIFNKRTGQPVQGGTVQSSSIPPGMKQVGTSGGKPVYQDAQGNRFIGD